MTQAVLNADPFLLTSNELATRFDVTPPRQFIHRVTLVNHKIDRSMKLDVITLSESFTDICREISYLRDLYKLGGYTLCLEADIELISGDPF
ncbi:MAG: hypothetical protein KME45_03265 [Stenomitos rutilans HA7619-LM2]|jgi:hypothetical protein|nr:hypothetical protein [Stenomitos rutilans HA7619-LM2]MBW4469404.1 hypothetical protein [Stenomitos rutilans HA7619-LM2]